MPAHLSPTTPDHEAVDAIPVLNSWARGTLVGLTLGIATVFAVAAWLNPYDDAGQPLRMETHRQLGLPPCTFYKWTKGLPCPACGMTTSFALLAHGDIWNSLRANAVGTVVALFCLVLIPWNLACCIRGRTYFIRSIEQALTGVVSVFIVSMLLRWAIVLAWIGIFGKS